MSASVFGSGPVYKSCEIDEDGHRDYTIVWRVKCTNYLDGPDRVRRATGLPQVGDSWDTGNDDDPPALCWPKMTITPHSSSEGKPEKEYYWTVKQLFSTKPLHRCQDEEISDPLAEPMKISGSFARFQARAERDRHGKAILSSSHEQIEGLEKDASRPTVVIEQNVEFLEKALCDSMVDKLNNDTMWGYPARKIKLSNFTWERLLYGVCTYYFKRRFEFETRGGDDIGTGTGASETGWDLTDVADTGYKEFNTTLVDGDRENPLHFNNIQDSKGKQTPQKHLLDGNGSRLEDPTNPVFLPTIELYDEANFTLLGIPTVLE